MNYEVVDHIPIIWQEPMKGSFHSIVIWIPYFSGDKEQTIPQLEAIAAEGYLAVSFDPVQHGERRLESNDRLAQRVTGNIRRNFWPILAQTAEEVSRVIDWAKDRFGFDGGIAVGGISMGGDIAITAAGIDVRITAVAACVATPDWLRPGSHEPPGFADTYAQRCYETHNPMTNLQHYSHKPAICFLCGALDTQVPPEAADRFVNALQEMFGSESDHLKVTKFADVPHQFAPAMLQGALEWFRVHLI